LFRGQPVTGGDALPRKPLVNSSEDLRPIQDEWARFWHTDQPSHMTYDRIIGGIEPKGDDDPKGRLFSDLVAYAPGMDTSRADIQAALEAEAMPARSGKLGQIDDGARRLLDKARPDGWQTLQLHGESNGPAFTITFDGNGRYASERVLPPGIREKVVCD